jgi:hypothetical protein
MTTAYTPILQLALPVVGELNGTWGTVVNDNITSMIEQAIAGLATISTWTTASHTLTTADGTTDEARCAMLECSGAPGAAATVICPARTKLFVIKNSVSGGYAVTLKTSAGTGISVPNGSTALLYCDGTNVVSGANYMATLVTTSITDSGLTSGRVVYAGTGGLLQDAAALTFDGTILSATKFAGALNGSVGATTPSTAVFTSVTNSSLTSGRVLYAGTGGLVQDAAALTFDGTILSATQFAGALNGTVGATTASTGAFTTVSATGVITSTLATGTAPFTVASTTNVANLNASSLNGATFAAPGSIGSGTAGSGAFTTLTASSNFTPTSYTETIVASGTVGASATLAITAGTVLTATLTSATPCTFTMPTATAGKSFTLLLKQPASGSATTATFTGVKWGTAGAPTITATVGKLDILAFVADGTNWYGTASQGYTY